MSFQKGFTSILIVVLIALAVTGGYLIYQKQFRTTSTSQQTTKPILTSTLSPEPSSSASAVNWKTYSNKQFDMQFSFRYPSTYALTTETKENPKDGKEVFIVGFADYNKIRNGEPSSFTVFMYKDMRQNTKERDLICNTLQLHNNLSIDDCHLKTEPQNPQEYETYPREIDFTAGQKTLFIIEYQHYDKELIKQILSTSKFN